ncbi:MAG: hypothetical protein ACK4L7_03850, partial [Flavobacteriales bacterium]
MKKPLLLPIIAVLAGCAQQQLRLADRAHDRMAYAEAAARYEKALSRIEDRAAMLRAAESHRRLADPRKAAEWFARADKLGPLSAEHALAYGRVLLELNRPGDAAAYLQQVLADQPEHPVARELGLAVADRDAFFADTTLFTVAPLHIDGVASAFAAVPMGGTLLFAAERIGSGRQNPWNGESFLDLCTVQEPQGILAGAATPLPGQVNGRFHDGPAALNPDGRTLYFTRSDYHRFRLMKDEQGTSHLMLFSAELQPDGTWGKVASFAYNGEDFSAGHAAISADGATLYYISDMPGGHGGTDLYACQRTADGWGLPRNLGPTLNTPGNEMFP